MQVVATRQPTPPRPTTSRQIGLERRLAAAIEGEVRFDLFTRGRYASDASIYQIMPAGVAFPKSVADLQAILTLSAEHGVPVIARGGGTSQNGQPIGEGLVVDFSRYLNDVIAYDRDAATVTARPGLVLEQLNAKLRADGLFFPVEPSTASRCTIGGMAGNNSSGARSLRFGKMVDNVLAIDALFHDGEVFGFGPMTNTSNGVDGGGRANDLARRLVSIAEREESEIEARYPKVQRRVGGYNLDALVGGRRNLAHLLVGSEGTLALSTAIMLKLSPLPKHRVIGVCQFPSFRAAMEATRHLVALGPIAVELVDNNILVLGRDIPLFRNTLAKITRGTPDCLLIVEFAGDALDPLKVHLEKLDQCMADHGFSGAVVEVTDTTTQRQIWDVREACLNIMMSMKGDAKPVSFIEDCAVPLEHLADYTAAVTEIFARHDTRGTWYAHASVGCLHVRPILDMKTAGGVAAMRAIADEVSSEVRRFKGSYSGEHGDGISRSEYVVPMFGDRLGRAFEEVKDAFDPDNRLNPGKIVHPLRMDDRGLMRFAPGYATPVPAKSALDWSEWGGFGGAVEMCNNNGTCRKLSGGGMCPSYRATKDETHVTRGRANALRLAISGQLGADALTSPEMKQAMDLCVGCKACKRECPTGVDMALMKTEFLAHYHARHGLLLKERLIAYLPRYAPHAVQLRGLLNLRDRIPGAAMLSEKLLGFSAQRSLPRWQKPWRPSQSITPHDDVMGDGRDLVLFADTFNRYFEPENLAAAERVLAFTGYRLHHVEAADSKRPLCCGRTFLASGLIDEARVEAERTAKAVLPYVEKGCRVIGLEPSCLLTLRDEFKVLLPRDQHEQIAGAAFLFEEALEADLASEKVSLPLKSPGAAIAHLHGHCHQKALDAFGPVEKLLRRIPNLDVRTIESACCGMAGAFGYDASHIGVSKQMAELSLLPALRKAGAQDLIVADGTSCRHQIADGLAREAIHVVRVLDRALAPAGSDPADLTLSHRT